MLTFTNPRIKAEFSDWPIGGSNRGQCIFEVHHDKRGYRVSRQTTDKRGQWCKPKFKTYSGPAAIVDGSDGRTYILQVAHGYGFVMISRSDFLDATLEVGREPGKGASVFERDDPELHAALLKLIVDGGAVAKALVGSCLP